MMEKQQFQFDLMRPMSAPAKMGLIVFGIVLFLPIFALAIIAGVLAAAVFGLLFATGVVRRKFRSLFSSKDTDGRKNVRIKR